MLELPMNNLRILKIKLEGPIRFQSEIVESCALIIEDLFLLLKPASATQISSQINFYHKKYKIDVCHYFYHF